MTEKKKLMGFCAINFVWFIILHVMKNDEPNKIDSTKTPLVFFSLNTMQYKQTDVKYA